MTKNEACLFSLIPLEPCLLEISNLTKTENKFKKHLEKINVTRSFQNCLFKRTFQKKLKQPSNKELGTSDPRIYGTAYVYLFCLKWCSVMFRYQKNLIFPIHITIKLYLHLYGFYFIFLMSLYLAVFTCLSAWLPFHVSKLNSWYPKLPDLYFLISYFVILISHSGWTFGFYLISFPICPPYIYWLSSSYHLFNLFPFHSSFHSFPLLLLCFMFFFLSKNS